MSRNPDWLRWAQRIQAIAQTGLTYVKDPYDAERYRELADLAAEIISNYAGQPVEVVAGMLEREGGYATPKVDVRAVVFDDAGRILLVREAAEGLWSLPGGWGDVGDSPGEVAVREAREESGYQVRPVKVLAVFDRSRHGHEPPMLWYIYKLFIQCELVGGAPAGSIETDGVGFFGLDELPPLSVSRVTEAQLRRFYEHYRNPALPTEFD